MGSESEFQYVVERKKPGKVCFLSTRSRGFYDKIEKENYSAGPYNLEKTSALNKILNKVRSKKGVGGLASNVPRFGQLISDDTPMFYELLPKKTIKVQTKFPFGSRLTRFQYRFSDIPGPGTYDTPSRCRTTKMCQTFGGPRKMKPAIETLCIARPIDRCIMCNEICDGDYWHKDETIYICSICMMIERIRHKQFATKELKEFQRIRNCSYMHQHEGTTAAIRKMNKKTLLMKSRKENYLDLFFKPY